MPSAVADLGIVKGGGGQLNKGGSGGPPSENVLKFVLFYWSFITHFTLSDSLKVRLSKSYQPGIV